MYIIYNQYIYINVYNNIHNSLYISILELLIGVFSVNTCR